MREPSSRSASPRRVQVSASTRSAETDERLRQHTRTNQQPSRRSSPSPSARRSSRRAREGSYGRQPTAVGGGAGSSVVSAILGVFGAIGSGIIGLFSALRDLVPALQRFSAGALAAFAGGLIVVVLGIGFVFGDHGAPEPTAIETDLSEESQQQEVSASSASDVNPDEPADLVWRDTDFALDPSFHDWSNKDNGRKVVFLTVDDGPSKLTEQFLDLFDKYNVKATFFITGHDPDYYHLIRDAYNRGHTIGLHSMTHDYNQIYASEEAFLKDLDEVGQVVKDQIGYIPCFIRFPGGSSNTQAENLSKGLMPKLVNTVQALGYQYYDWSLASGDGEDRSTSELISISTESNGSTYDPTKDTNIVLLCHDSATKQTTLEALPKIIEFYQSKGYSFEAIDRKTWICHHNVYIPEGTTSDAQDVQADAQGQDTYGGTDDSSWTDTSDETSSYEEYGAPNDSGDVTEGGEESYY